MFTLHPQMKYDKIIKNKGDQKDKNMENIIEADFPSIPEEKNYVVCYIDFLGAKEIIEKGQQQTFFENIHDAFAFAIKFESKLKVFGNLEFKVFSDNILIAHKVKDVSDKEQVYRVYNNIIHFLKTFAPRFTQQAILFRGGITLGKAAMNEIMVWGNALVEVVQIEENIAIYPRIVISDKLLNIFNTYDLEDYEFEEKFSCLKDTDGCVFVDYINYSEPPTSQITIEEGYLTILEKIKECNSPKILQKYNWHKNYLQRAKEIHNEYFESDSDYYIDLKE